MEDPVLDEAFMRRYRELLDLDSIDAGLRLVVRGWR